MCATPVTIKSRRLARRRECSLLLHRNSDNDPKGVGNDGSSYDAYELVKSADGTNLDIATNSLRDFSPMYHCRKLATFINLQ